LDDGFRTVRIRESSGGFRHLVGFQAVRANRHPARTAIDIRADFLQVWHPAPARKIVRMRNVVAAYRFLAANITHTCHHFTLIWKSFKYNQQRPKKQGFSSVFLNVAAAFRTIIA
jgi:hypothetical protein